MIFTLYRCLLSPVCPLFSDKLEGNSVIYSVVERFDDVFVLVS